MKVEAPLTTVIDTIDATVMLPTTGTFEVALLDERDGLVHLANEGVREDGWLELFPR